MKEANDFFGLVENCIDDTIWIGVPVKNLGGVRVEIDGMNMI